MLERVVIPVTAVGCGLMAGVFFAFSAFVMRALARLPVTQGVAVMQSINSAVMNVLFMGVFMGTAALALVVIVLGVLRRGEAGMGLLIAGGVLYLLGTFMATVVGNVPLNDRLAGVVPDSPEAAVLWAVYVKQWTVWNHVRTVAAVAAMAALIGAMYQRASAS